MNAIPGCHRLRPLSLVTVLSILAMTACGESQPPGNPATSSTVVLERPQPDPVIGQSDFVSADGHPGQRTQENTSDGNAPAGEAAAAPEADAGADRADDRSVEEGDIYRVVHGQDLLLNLNSFRGLQIIDMSDVSQPRIIGRVSISGTPVEMYQIDDRVFILMNNWYGYYGSRDDVSAEQYHGGVVVVVDISDVRHPRITAQAQVPGHIQTSRLTRGNDKEALFVVANGGGNTYVRSFSVSSDGKLDARSELDLGGWVSDIQATAERLLVARTDYSSNRHHSLVAVIDISDPDGAMVEGASVPVRGHVRTQFNMDLRGDQLRIVSGGGWTTNTNYLETFDASDIHHIRPLDLATFGDNEDLYATLFLENSAFFVTYRRIDPFHAFEIKPDGSVFERSEFVISGWNDYFRAVSNQSRLIGIGKNDENGRNTMAVSLYDITDLYNPNPFIARQEIELDYSWSEAQWDHRAFSVLEKAVRVEAATGELETGLVLLPFTGWDRGGQRYISAVQIFTFSDDTLTLRGTMEHGTPVRRSFVARRDHATTANLSEAELTIFDTSAPDQPVELGRLDLAPDYTEFLLFGSHGVRRQNRSQYYWWWGWGHGGSTSRMDSLEIISMSGDPDEAEAVAQIDIPARAQIYRVGSRLVVLELVHRDEQSRSEPIFDGIIQVWNLSAPASPVLEAVLETDAIRGSHHYYYDRHYSYVPRPQAVSLDGSLVFVNAIAQRELQGTVHYRNTYPRNSGYTCWETDQGSQTCSYLTGGIHCTRLERVDGTFEEEVCHGELRRCERDGSGNHQCVAIEPASIRTRTSQYKWEQYRYWNQYEFVPVDLSGSGVPTLGPTLTMAETEEAVTVLGRGDRLYFNYKQPTRVAGDSRPYVRYHYRSIDLTRPSSPVLSPSINIPGELIAVDGDLLITKDLLWGERIVETSLNKVRVANGRARLEGLHRFVDQYVHQVALDDAGHLLVSHQQAYLYDHYYDDYYGGRGSDTEVDYRQRLSILDARQERFALVTTTIVDRWASLRAVEAGRALFSVPGGLLVINVEEPTAPVAQAYFPAQGWPRDIAVAGDDLVVAAGRHGLYRFDMSTFNLIER
jgi:hypothetical protein